MLRVAKQIKHFLDGIVLEEHVWKLKLLSCWSEIIRPIMGPAKSNVILEHIGDDSVILGVLHGAVAQELLFLVPKLKKSINTVLDQERIVRIRFRVIEPTKARVRHKKKKTNNFLKRKISLDYALEARSKHVVSHVRDKELQLSLKQFFMRCAGMAQK